MDAQAYSAHRARERRGLLVVAALALVAGPLWQGYAAAHCAWTGGTVALDGGGVVCTDPGAR